MRETITIRLSVRRGNLVALAIIDDMPRGSQVALDVPEVYTGATIAKSITELPGLVDWVKRQL